MALESCASATSKSGTWNAQLGPQVANGLGTGMSFLLASQVVTPVDQITGGLWSPTLRELAKSLYESRLLDSSELFKTKIPQTPSRNITIILAYILYLSPE